MKFGWYLLPHPSYSPDLEPPDYHVFRSLKNSLDCNKFNNDDNVKLHLEQFYASKEQKFYERGIMRLPERWQKVNDITMDNIILRKCTPRHNYPYSNEI